MTVQLVKGQAASDSISGLVSGNLDAAALTLDETLRVLVAGVPATSFPGLLVLRDRPGGDLALYHLGFRRCSLAGGAG